MFLTIRPYIQMLFKLLRLRVSSYLNFSSVSYRLFLMIMLLGLHNELLSQTSQYKPKKYRIDAVNKAKTDKKRPKKDAESQKSKGQDVTAASSRTLTNEANLLSMPQLGDCSIYGAVSVVEGPEYEYFLECASGLTADYWEIECGVAKDWYGNMVLINWSTNNCSSSYVRAMRFDGTILATLVVDISQNVNGGTISNPQQTIGAGQIPATIFSTSPNASTCLSAYAFYQWQSSTDGVNFVDIPGANDESYQPGSLFVTTYFRRRATCSSDVLYTVNNAVITVYATPLEGGCVLSSDQTVLISTIPQTIYVTASTGGACGGLYQYQWQRSTDNQYFENIPGATSENLSFTTPLSQTTYFQRRTTCGNEVTFVGIIVVRTTNTLQYYNEVTSGTYTKNDCTSGTGSTVVYTVPAGTYSSSISLADANAQAQNDINSNGQSYANTNGYCFWGNTMLQVSFSKSNCIDGGVGSTVVYTIPANTFISQISQADADQKAQSDATANGQNYANFNGYCTWFNDAIAGNYYSNVCQYGFTPLAYYATVAASQFSSTISKADANNKAQMHAQSLANANGSCQDNMNCSANCTGEGQKCIDGNCESGYQVYTESYYDYWLGLYVCVYHYEWSDGSWSPNYYFYSTSGSCFY